MPWLLRSRRDASRALHRRRGDRVPGEARKASLGCGNLPRLAELPEGEVVLDHRFCGSVDVLRAARRVGAAGKVYTMDVADAMLSLAGVSKRRSGLANVESLRDEVQSVPSPDSFMEVAIFNGVSNPPPAEAGLSARRFECCAIVGASPPPASSCTAGFLTSCGAPPRWGWGHDPRRLDPGCGSRTWRRTGCWPSRASGVRRSRRSSRFGCERPRSSRNRPLPGEGGSPGYRLPAAAYPVPGRANGEGAATSCKVDAFQVVRLLS